MVSFLTVRDRNGIAARVIVVAELEGGMAAERIRIAKPDPTTSPPSSLVQREILTSWRVRFR
jgi:hypothetical protein